jgi:hypothetical protein
MVTIYCCNQKKQIKMKKIIINLSLLALGLIMSNTVTAQTSSVWATVESLEALKQNESFQSLEQELNLTYEQALPSSRQEHLQKVYEFKCDCDEVDLYASMHKINSVSKIEYGPKYESLSEPNDYNILYGNTSWHLDLIQAQLAWQFTTGDVDIAISDQNYFAEHEELVGAVSHYDSTNTSSQGHGTAVAITAAGNTNNDTGLSSIGYNSTLSLYRMNYGEVLSASYNGAKVINLSWTSGCDYNQYLQDAINEIYENGTFIVAAAGNGSTCGGPEALVYPAAFDNVFAVSSIGENDSHDNPNGGTTHQHNSSVDIMAPGYDLPISAAPGWYLYGSGTSYASPIVAGTVGLMISVNPDITNEEIETILAQTAWNIDEVNPQYVGKMGSGRLSAGNAVAQVQRNLDIAAANSDDDGNNGHGNDEDGVDDTNPGNGNNNPNFEQIKPHKGDGNTVVRPSGNIGNVNNVHKLMNDASNERIVIYPNPAHQHFRIKWDNVDMKTLYIYSSAFQIVQRHNLEELAQDRISISILEPGMYVAMFVDSEGNRYKRRISIF